MDGLNEIVTNDEVEFTYTPSKDVQSYSYIIKKNGNVIERVEKTEIDNTSISLKEEGKYRLEFTEKTNEGKINVKTYSYIIDKTPPVILLSEKTYKITSKESFDLNNKISSKDNFDGNVTDKIETNIDSMDFTKTGIKKIEVTSSDKAGNISKEMIYVTVVKDNTNLIRLGQISIALVTVFIISFLFNYIRSIKREKRFSKYAINSKKNDSISLLDNLFKQYEDFINKYSKIFSKSSTYSHISSRYKKYTSALDNDDYDGTKFLFRKIVVGFIYVTVVIIINLIKGKLTYFISMILPFILGYFTLDIIYLYKYYRYRRLIENDMFNAITIMNNAFKTGKSIKQAVELVSIELSGPIANEFKKISLELSFGLDIEVAFKRFSERIDLKEAVYLTSSLSVLSKTGGNIVKVFDSIEKNLFNRRKLETEFKSLTSSSKMIMYVLMFVPIAFILFIYFVNPSYFSPIFESTLGLILLFIVVLIYVSYIFTVKRIMKVRGIR